MRHCTFVVLLLAPGSAGFRPPPSPRARGDSRVTRSTARGVERVTCESPLELDGAPAASARGEKPLLLYLPGIDGTYLPIFTQLPELARDYDVRCLTIAPDDRSTFSALAARTLPPALSIDFFHHAKNTSAHRT